MSSQKPEEGTLEGREPASPGKEGQKLSEAETRQLAVDSNRGQSLDGRQEVVEVEDRVRAVAGLAVLLKQAVAYFSERADVDDLDILSFSLHHLFCCVDYCYRIALPEVMSINIATDSEQAFAENLLRRQHTWMKLRAIKAAVTRIESLCQLLNNAIEYLLDALDVTAVPDASSEDTVPRLATREDNQDWLHSVNQEPWKQALAAVTANVSYWQENYARLTPFTDQFARLASSVPSLSAIDEAFLVLLDCAGAIFGDIVPSFQAISANDDEAVCTLLFDLMQQVDQLQVQFDSMMEPLQTLIKQFDLGMV